MEAEKAHLTFEQVLGVLRRRAGWILGCVLVVSLAAYGFSERQTKKYTAVASLVFSETQLNQQVAGLQTAGVNNSVAQQNTNLKLVQLGNMAEKTASALGHGLTKEDVYSALSISSQNESNIVNVAATSTSPTLAAAIANTYTQQFVSEQQNSNHAYYSSALALVNKQLLELSPSQRVGAEGLTLESRAQSLAVLAELRTGGVQIAQAATTPTFPSAPRVKRNTAIGLLLGLLLGLTVAVLLERFDRRIREPKDLEKIYGLPLLGVVPESRSLAGWKQRDEGAKALPASEAEAFHMIRAHLRYFNVDHELRTLLVTSAAPGDGKTTIAVHLAAAAARMGARVLLIEADLRRPTVAKKLEIPSGPGVSDVLIGAVPVWDATQSIDLDELSGGMGHGRHLDVLVAGTVPPPNPSELIESHAMELLLEQAKSHYELVVIDTSPLAAVSDAFPLLLKVEGIIIVGRVGRNRSDVAERLNATLAGVGAPLLGVVANGLKTGGLGSYSYDYSYAAATSPNGAAGSQEAVPAGNT
jgi:capsular exopolysaccharide synthesis family protein